MKTSTSILSSFLAVVVAFVIGIYFYPHLPQLMATHWGLMGQVNGYMLKFWGTFMLPFIMFFAGALLYVIPILDPMKDKAAHFQKEYNKFIVFFVLFLLYVYVLTVYANLGYAFNMIQFLMPALAILWFMIGELLPKVKRNWFIGIRTPWTRADEAVWDKTHVFGGFIFQLSAFVILIGAFFPASSFWFILIPLIVSVLGPVFYSYALHRKMKMAKK